MTLLDRFNAKWEKDETGCWIWRAGKYATGYGTIMVGSKKDGTKCSALAHRVSYELHKGPITGGMHVLHTCDVRACVNPKHLFLGTNSDNISDAVNKGRKFKKLTTRKVEIINELINRGVKLSHVAKLFGVTPSALYRHLP